MVIHLLYFLEKFYFIIIIFLAQDKHAFALGDLGMIYLVIFDFLQNIYRKVER
mgnify:CR=1 FL=1